MNVQGAQLPPQARAAPPEQLSVPPEAEPLPEIFAGMTKCRISTE